MESLGDLQNIVGPECVERISGFAEKQVAAAKSMPLKDEYRQDKYYYRSWKYDDLLSDIALFDSLDLKITPIDIANILFESKILFASQTEEEFIKRSGGRMWHDDSTFAFSFNEKSKDYESVVDDHIKRLTRSIASRTLVSKLSHFDNPSFGLKDEMTVKIFFDDLFAKINLPFFYFGSVADLPNGISIFTDFPSMGFKTEGSEHYTYLKGAANLRNFLNLLRVAGYIHHGQMNFGWNDVELMAPTSPVFLGSNSMGTYSWDEDTKKPWCKLPDGCLFLSFGYRGLAKMYLDGRTFAGIREYILENQIIFNKLDKPWTNQCVYDIEPILNLLSATVQMPDAGAKILLLYCCLEHLFVPKNVSRDNYKYIIGGLNALKPHMVPWFNELYRMRCDYAHKGYILRDKQSLGLTFQSVRNVMALLISKIDR